MPEHTPETNPVRNPVPTLSGPCAPPVAGLVAAALRAGIALWPEAGTLRARGPREGRPVGEQIVARKADVMAYLGTWSPAAALALEAEADAGVEALGVSGRDDVIRAAAAACVDAHRARDLFGVYDACRRIRVQALALAAARGEAA